LTKNFFNRARNGALSNDKKRLLTLSGMVL